MSRTYRRLVRLYPRSFRDEFGDDLVALFEDQRDADGGTRAWLRASRDLLVTVPTQHLEAVVHRRSPRTVSALVAVLGATLLLVGVAIGSAVSPLLLLVGVSLAVGGAMSWQQHRDVVAPTVVQSWWKVLLSGPALIVTIIVVRGMWPRSLAPGDDLAWLLTFSSVILAITLTAAGALLGGVALVNRLQASRRTTGR